MVVLIPLLLLIVPVVLGVTLTVFDVQQGNGSPLPEGATYDVLGTNTNGAISLLEQVPVTEIVEFTTVDGSPVPTTVPTSFVAEETYIISSGGYARFQALTADIGAINFLEACTYGPGGDARCIQEAWAATGGPTQTTEYTGTIVPVYTLTVDESSSQSSGSSTSPSSTATSRSATSLTSSGTGLAPPQVTDGGDTSDDTDAGVALFSRGLGPALAAGMFLTIIML